MGLRAAAIVAASLLAGCALISGAADLEVGALPSDSPEVDAGGVVEASLPPRPDASADGPVAIVLDGALPDGAPSTRLREVTFESGVIKGKDGADQTSGSPLIESFSPVAGKHSARLDKDDAIEVDFAPVPEIYATFLVRFENIGLGTEVFLRIGTATTLDVEIAPGNAAAAVQVHVGPVVLGPGGSLNDSGQTYRMGIHLRQVGTSTGVEVFVAARGAAFGVAAVAGSVGNAGKLHSLQLGAIKGGNIKSVVDDILIDTVAMPPP
jgi:hypothetical protein